jgi:hypothetical protein
MIDRTGFTKRVVAKQIKRNVKAMVWAAIAESFKETRCGPMKVPVIRTRGPTVASRLIKIGVYFRMSWGEQFSLDKVINGKEYGIIMGNKIQYLGVAKVLTRTAGYKGYTGAPTSVEFVNGLSSSHPYHRGTFVIYKETHGGKRTRKIKRRKSRRALR